MFWLCRAATICGTVTPHFVETVRIHPDAHRILTSAENLHARDAVHSSKFVYQVDVGIIGEKHAVVTTFG